MDLILVEADSSSPPILDRHLPSDSIVAYRHKSAHGEARVLQITISHVEGALLIVDSLQTDKNAHEELMRYMYIQHK